MAWSSPNETLDVFSPPQYETPSASSSWLVPLKLALNEASRAVPALKQSMVPLANARHKDIHSKRNYGATSDLQDNMK